MAAASGRQSPGPTGVVQRFRCRCGHLPTQHMSVVPVESSGNFRLAPIGPCEICGPGLCPAYSPALRNR